jgi:hypothetical protein
MCLPSPAGIQNEPTTETKGNAISRNINRQITATQESARQGDTEAELRLALMNIVNENDHSNEHTISDDNISNHRFGIIRKKAIERKVVVSLNDLFDRKVHVQTGFRSVISMLSYIAVVCDGDIDKIKSSSSILTWLEEWYLFFEVIYGRSCPRWVDLEFKYLLSSSAMRKVYDNKLNQVLEARKNWPRFVSIDEDQTYRKPFKWDAYQGKRVVMYDNTNITMKQPSDAEAQRATYSLYYRGNVGKGAVHVQPCGWIGSSEIWTGGVSDSFYMENGEVFPTLNHYLLTAHTETEESRKVKFLIILDRGYRVAIAALNTGGHCVLQPIFAPVDRHFTTDEIHHSSTVATDRAGNERAVKYLKISDYINRGMLFNKSSERLSNTWLAWGFQVNFMYRPVH